MKLDLTEQQLEERFRSWSAGVIVQFLVDFGLELKPKMAPMKAGIYRRVRGTDLICVDASGNITRVDCHERQIRDITWAMNYEDAWKLVLDGHMKPVENGFTVWFDRSGKRVR